jgi:osmotically-inducible protein OsmY
METTDESPTDAALKADVLRFFQESADVDPSEIEVSVSDGVVTLGGCVEAVPEKRRAREIAETTPGVKMVEDEMRVRNFVERGDDELKSAIVNHLSRDAWVESIPTLEIYVSGGEVRLEGTCKTWAERHTIAQAVWWVPGVRNVENLIHPTEEPQDIVPGLTVHFDRESL